MKERVLAIGVEGLPRNVYTLKWEEALDKGVNITDYDIVFIDFSSCPVFADGLQRKEFSILYTKLNQLLNKRKFFEVLKGDIKLFIFATDNTPFHWLTECIEIDILKEPGTYVEPNSTEFQDYLRLLNQWEFCFTVENNTYSEPYLGCDIIPIAFNKAKNYLGVLLSNFKLFSDLSYVHREIKAEFPGEIYIIHTLYENTKRGVLSILHNLFDLSFTRKSPDWSKNVEFERSEEIRKIIKELEKNKSELNEKISKNIYELEKLNEFKKLLWETEHELERIVHKCFKELLSIDISEPTKSEENGVFEYSSFIFVVEIKSGENRGAKFEELSKLITRMDNIKKKSPGKYVKGIFIMNHYADYPLNDRKEAFPDNVKKTAKVNNVKLLTTIELFDIVKKMIDKKIAKMDAIKKILET
jgi:hypothetical protein